MKLFNFHFYLMKTETFKFQLLLWLVVFSIVVKTPPQSLQQQQTAAETVLSEYETITTAIMLKSNKRICH